MMSFILGFIAGFALGILYSKSKTNKETLPTTEGRAPRMIVGAYNPETNQTWVYTEGSPTQGHWVDGSLNVPIGTIYTAN